MGKKAKKDWKFRLVCFMRRNGLEPSDNIWECARLIRNSGVANISNIEHKSWHSIKNELCKIVKDASHSSGKKKKPNKKDTFYSSWEWKKLRFEVLKYYGAKCMLCGSKENICVDHIYPRKKYPKLALNFHNMQVLCNDCNMGKSNDDFTDFRSEGDIDVFLDRLDQ